VINFGAPVPVEPEDGDLVVTASFHAIAPGLGGDAVVDTLVGGVDGDAVLLTCASSGATVTFTNAGNIRTRDGLPVVLNDADKTLLLVRVRQTAWAQPQ